jgi:hypothetical protein
VANRRPTDGEPAGEAVPAAAANAVVEIAPAPDPPPAPAAATAIPTFDLRLFDCLTNVWTMDDCPRNAPSFPGWPLPSSFLVAIGARRGGAWMFGFVVAIVATVIALGAHLSIPSWDHRLVPLLIGITVGLGVGVSLTFASRSASSACSTYPDQLKELHERVREAIGRLGASPIASDTDDSTARNVVNLLCGLIGQLSKNGPEWLDGSGFLDSWAALHEAEENLLLIEVESEVTSSALYDLLRLNGSKIASKDALTTELRVALPLLSSSAAAQIGVPPAAAFTPDEARRRIRTVRIAIDEDREQQWDQIVRSRNGLITAGVVAMGIAYLLVVFGVGFSAAPNPLGSALVFALTGALVSGTYQLQFRSNAVNEVEDFGFTTVKIVVVPILAGLTAVLAIAFLTQFQLVVSGQTLGGTFSSWQATFDWRKNPTALATAILFGFAPSLFFSFLQNKADDALKSIKSSQPSGGG